MLEKKITDLLNFGVDQWYLEFTVNIGTSIHAKLYVLDTINRYLASLESLGFTVTLRASHELKELRDELQKMAKDATLVAAQADRLKKIMKEIRPTLWAESGGMIAHIISERRFPIERLIENMAPLFGKDVFNKLPKLAQQDFAEAGKCLAFERPTAAAFHMLRGTESTLRQYYCFKLHRKRSELMWGPMVASMRKFPRRFPAALLNHLDHIRSSFRNPTAHPEKIYDIDEAQDLLSICIDVSNRMAVDLSDLAKDAPPKPQEMAITNAGSQLSDEE